MTTTTTPAGREKSAASPAGWRHRFVLDASVTCLNHGMLGACPSVVLERQSELRARLERQPAAFILRELNPLLDDARQALADLLSCRTDDLALVPNVTTALSSVLRSRAFSPGDEILTTDHAYLSCTNLLDFIARQTGARVVTARVPVPLSGPDEVVDAVLARVTPRTRLAVLDHVTSPTAIVFPIATLVQRLAAQGIDTVVDGAHAPGMLALDVEALGAAYYVGDCHKWLCSPRGAGFLHARRDRQADLHPAVISRGYGASGSGRLRLHREFDWLGTTDPTPLLCIPESIRFLRGLLPGGLPDLFARNRAMAIDGTRHLPHGLPQPITRLAPDSMLASMVAYRLPDPPGPAADDAAASLQLGLYDRHRIDVAVAAWPSAGSRTLRVSAQVYNSIEDFIRLGTALSAELARSHDGRLVATTTTAGTGS